MLTHVSGPQMSLDLNFNTSRTIPQLCVSEVSYGKSEPGRVNTPRIHDHYCIHFILRGRLLHNDSEVAAGDVFLSPPKIVHQEKFLPDVPCEQYWITFDGTEAARLISGTALADSDILRGVCTPLMYDALHEAVFGSADEVMLPRKFAGLLIHLTSLLGPSAAIADAPAANPRTYVNRACAFLRANFDSGIGVSDAADYVRLSEKYLCRLFKKELGIPPQEYLADCRNKRARTLLTHTEFEISDISRMVGIEDPTYFSRFFRRMNGISPTQFRQWVKEHESEPPLPIRE